MSNRLTAKEIETQRFHRKMRGLDAEEVALFLKSVAEEVERLHLENGEMREEVGRLRGQVDDNRTREKLLQETLVSAQSMSGEIKQKARYEADLSLKEARLKAEQTVVDSRSELSRLEAEISRSKLEKDLFEKRLRAVIDEHLSLLDRRREGGEALDNVHVLPDRSQSEAG